MIEGLGRYPAYRESGIEWVGEVPRHWKTPTCQRVFRETTRPYQGTTEVQLSLSQRQGLVPTTLMHERSLQTSSFDKWKVVHPGDIVVNRFKGHLGVFFAANMRGITTFHYGVFRSRTAVVAKYFEWLFHTPQYCAIFGARSNGMTVGLQNLSNQNFYNVRALLPPPDEQAAIVRFIDHADRRIRRYIREKQKLIGLLEEQKQAIIHRAVTRGLDPNVRLKPSGVEWLGDVPHHWEVVALRRRWQVTDCKHLTVPFVDDGYPLASVRQAQSFELTFSSSNRTTREWFEKLIEGGRRPKRGDLVYCRNVSVGAAALVTTDEPFAMGQDVCLIRSEGQCQRWLNYFLRCHAMKEQLGQILVGSTFNRINVADIKALLVVVPPRDEQDRIVAHLDREVGTLNAAIEELRAGQALIREYRTRLIADVVTGKLDVRAAAAALPDEPAEDEPLDAVADDPDDEADDVAELEEEEAAA